MNADEILFHPSANGEIMTNGNVITEKQLETLSVLQKKEKRTDKQEIELSALIAKRDAPTELSLTCKRRLIKIFREIKYRRKYSHSNKYTEKGTRMEEDGITLYSRFKKKHFTKNKIRLQNKYFNGEIDILEPTETIDIKCSWDLSTFPHPLTDKPDIDYVYQGQSYLDLAEVTQQHTVAYCLVNTPANLILSEKQKLWYKMDCPADANEAYIKGKIEIEKNMIFDMKQFMRDNPNTDMDCKDWQYDIPVNERIVEFTFAKDEALIAKIKYRVDECRQWMNLNLFNS